jgi:alkylation response protein AidB-like acyl-CoA dehydrogenase
VFFGLSDEASELRTGVRDVLVDACTTDTVRAAWPGGDPAVVDRLWRALGDLGLLGLLVPEGNGGMGLDPLVAVAALEEAGYAGVPGPLVETVMVVAPVLAAVDSALLPDVLAGRSRVAVQRAEGIVPHADGDAPVLQLREDVRLLSGEAGERQPVAGVDGSRALATVVGSGTPLDVDATAAVRGGRLGTAALLLGLARRQVDLTTAYIRERKQFGVSVGSFQGLKHPMADAVVGTEFAWPSILRAAQSLIDDDPQADLHAATAKLLASEAAYRVSRVCLQAHGAIGYTTEYDLHLFVKRTWALVRDWGSPAELRTEIAGHLALNERTTSG